MLAKSESQAPKRRAGGLTRDSRKSRLRRGNSTEKADHQTEKEFYQSSLVMNVVVFLMRADWDHEKKKLSYEKKLHWYKCDNLVRE